AAKKKAASKASEPTFEERLEALEGVVADLEGEDLPLERSLDRYKQGVEHLRACRALLDDAEARLAELVGEGPDGEPLERGLRVGEGGLEADDAATSDDA
ncbi:MAG: exodeoxyribonuclease VII small subunit, partial [Planctomycetota bacterium]|nr:exodeoxyribonuclease VII small subunit [Planctomycetota bacterium]